MLALADADGREAFTASGASAPGVRVDAEQRRPCGRQDGRADAPHITALARRAPLWSCGLNE